MRKIIWPAVLLAVVLSIGGSAQTTPQTATKHEDVTVTGPTVTPEIKAKVLKSFHRRLPHDLKTYTVAQIFEAAQAAVLEATTPVMGESARRPRIRISIGGDCCPPRFSCEIGLEF